MMEIGEVAEYLGVSARTLRHYDKIGLVTPAFVGGKRAYTLEQIDFLKIVLLLRDLGLSISDIATINDLELGDAQDFKFRPTGTKEELIKKLIDKHNQLGSFITAMEA